MHKSWKFEWLTSWEEIWDHDFVNQWQSWMDDAHYAHVFFEPSVVKAWVLTYDKIQSIQPYFLIGRLSNETICFLPLIFIRYNWKNAWLRVLQPVGYSEFDYHDPIFTGDLDPKLIKKFWDEFEVECLERWKSCLDIIQINGLRSYTVSDNDKFVKTDTAPYIDLMSFKSSDEFLYCLNQKLRHDLRRQIRRIEDIGELKLRIIEIDENQEAMRMIQSFLPAHSENWPNSYRAPYYYENLIKYCLCNGILQLSELLLNNETISWHIDYNYKSRYYAYQVAYKQEFGQYSPGKIHLFMLIKESINKKIAIFDLLKGDEDYKRQWTKESVPLFNFKCTSKSWISSMRIFLFDTIKPAISKVVRSLKK